VVLGFNTIRNAVVSISIIDAFSVKEGLDGFEITDFWKHSLSVAVTSKYLASKTGIPSADDCFVAGLLHDMGKIVLLQHFKDLFQKIWIAAKGKKLSFYEAEKSQIPINHAQIGGHLARKWQLPEKLVDAVRHHHSTRPDTDGKNLSMIIHAADAIVNTYNGNSINDLDLSGIHPEAMPIMESHFVTIADWYPDVLTEVESASNFFLDESTK
jgi:putative nucleotidyltransferase with HDIG domain